MGNQDTTVQPDNTSCTDCIAAATIAAVSVAKFACQQAASCLVATCLSLSGPSITQPETERVYLHSTTDLSSRVLEWLYAAPMPLTMVRESPRWEGFASSKPSAFVRQLAVTVWTNDSIQRPAPTMQVFLSTQIIAFDLTGRVQTAPALIHMLLLPMPPRVTLYSCLLQQLTRGFLLCETCTTIMLTTAPYLSRFSAVWQYHLYVQ